MKQILIQLSFLVSFLCSILEARFFDYDQCVFSFDDNGINVTYNLTLLHLYGEAFQVDDYDMNEFRYEFQICGRLSRSYWTNSIPHYCYPSNLSLNTYETDGSPCLNISNSTKCLEYYNITNHIPSAIQINEGSQRCHWLGMEISQSDSIKYNMTNYSVGLYNAENGAAGITYTIMNGEFCSSSQPPRRNRRLIVELVCPDSSKQYFSPQIEAQKILNETVVEYPDCEYTLTITTPLACPARCIDINGTSPNQYSVCNGKGVCATDPIESAVKCLCDDGWTGDTCNKISETSVVLVHKQSSLLTAIIICIVLLTLALVLVLVLCYQIRQREETLRNQQKDYIQPLTDDDAANNNNNDTQIGHEDNANATMNKNDIQLNSVDPSIQNELTGSQ